MQLFRWYKKPSTTRNILRYFANIYYCIPPISVTRRKTPAGTGRWKQASHTWRAFEKLRRHWPRWMTAGEMLLCKSRGCADLGTSLPVKGWLLSMEMCPDTVWSEQVWQSMGRHQWGEQAQVLMPQCSLCCQTAPHLVPYLTKISLSQRWCAFRLLAWILGLITKQQLFQGDSNRTQSNLSNMHGAAAVLDSDSPSCQLFVFFSQIIAISHLYPL